MTDQAQSPHDDEEQMVTGQTQIPYQGEDLSRYKVAAGDDAESHPVSCTPGDLALHLVCEHADPMAMDRTHVFNEGLHHHEHTGPGTIRHHAEDDFSYDRAKVRAVLREAEGDDWQDEPVRAEIEEDELIRAVYRALAENDMPGDPPFYAEAGLKRLMDKLQLVPPVEYQEEPPFIIGSRPAGGKSDASSALAAEMLLRAARDGGEEDLAARVHLDVHLSSAHDDGDAWYRTPEENEAAHRAVEPGLHRHTDVQHRYERALVAKIEADAGDGTLVGWSPVPHPPHAVLDLARMVSEMHGRAPEMDPAMLAVDLAWIKIGTWPWHRRVRAAAMLAFSSRTPSWAFGWRFGKRGPGDGGGE
jgi:hypothetical protein